MFNLPMDVEIYILEFCMDKRVNWDKCQQQFLKGGFSRKNMNIGAFIGRQHQHAKEFWLKSRPEIKGLSGWKRSYSFNTEIVQHLPFKYQIQMEWCPKLKFALVLFTKHNNLKCQKRSASNPVSKWTNNIKKFEDKHEGPSDYLPKKITKFGILFKSAFYLKRKVKNAAIRFKKKQKEKARLFMIEREQLKIHTMEKKYGFTVMGKLRLSFSEANWKGTKMYDGRIEQIYFHDGKRLPSGKKRFDEKTIDDCIGNLTIRVCFDDGDLRRYTPEVLFDRVQTSVLDERKMKDIEDKLRPVNKKVNSEIAKYVHNNTINIVGINSQTPTGCINSQTPTIEILSNIYFNVLVSGENLLFDYTTGKLIGIYNNTNGCIETNITVYFHKRRLINLGITETTPTIKINGSTYYRIIHKRCNNVLVDVISIMIVGCLHISHEGNVVIVPI